MSLYKRKTVWWIRFTTPDGRRVRRSTGTGDRTQAQEYHDQVKAELWRTARLGVKPKRSWRKAVVRWLSETSHKATHETDKYHLRWLDAYLGNLMLDDITRDVIDRIKQAKKDQGARNATVNRMLSVLRAILRRAELDWEWLDHAPKVRLLPEPKRRVRWLHEEEAERLIAELPRHLKAMARFTLATGLRQGNVKGLRWSQVDLDRHIAWIHADQAKARKAIAVPLNAEAMKVLQSQLGKNPSYVFTYGGQTRQASEHESLETGTQACRHRRLSLARLTPYLGELACATGYTATRTARAGGLGNGRHGAPVCTPCSGAHRAIRRARFPILY